MNRRIAFDSPVLLMATWMAWAAPPLWFIGCAFYWKVTGKFWLWQLVPFWLMLLVAVSYWIDVVIARLCPGALGLALLFGVPVVGGVAATQLAGGEAGVTVLLALALVISSACASAGVMSRLLPASLSARLALPVCLASSLSLPAIVLGAAISFVGAWDGTSVSIAWPMWFYGGIALMIVGIALSVPAGILKRHARRRAREVLSGLLCPAEGSKAAAPPINRLTAVCMIAACSIPLGACGLLMAGALSDGSIVVAYAGLVVGALLGALLAMSAMRWLRSAN